jgi:hypothetical protein
MPNISSVEELKNAILLLEIEQAEKGRLLREQFYLTYESLKPVNLLKSTIKELFLEPNLIDNFIGTSLGLASGYLSKKIVVGASGNIIRKLVGTILQFGVTNVIAQHPGGIKSLGQILYHRIFDKKEVISAQS